MGHEHPGDLFAAAAAKDTSATPLAERVRPRSLDEFAGQQHLLGPQKILRRLIEADRIPTMILWGPPGTGKTTLARIIAAQTGAAFTTLSAVTAGVKDLRAVVGQADDRRKYEQRQTLLFVDEIHRFNKAQQDALLPHVERGVCRLIGATTENPSFEVNAALLSRARVFELRSLTDDDVVDVMRRALDDPRGLGAQRLRIDDDVVRAMARAAGGDARRALGGLEMLSEAVRPAQRGPDETVEVTAELAAQAMGVGRLRYDKDGEEHYNVVSALIKSLRASDADAAMYWMARMLEAGDDPMFVARRLVIFASEDVGNADPRALMVATAAASATHLIGMPEAIFPLSQAAMFLALCPKSNAALRAYHGARKDVQEHGALPVPRVIRNAVTGLMRQAGYGQGYVYPHDQGGVDPGHESYLPEELPTARLPYVEPGRHGWEAAAWAALQRRRGATDESGE